MNKFTIESCAVQEIRAIDCNIVFARDMAKMTTFYRDVTRFEMVRQLGDGWVEFAVGSDRLVITSKQAGALFNNPVPCIASLLCPNWCETQKQGCKPYSLGKPIEAELPCFRIEGMQRDR